MAGIDLVLAAAGRLAAVAGTQVADGCELAADRVLSLLQGGRFVWIWHGTSSSCDANRNDNFASK